MIWFNNAVIGSLLLGCFINFSGCNCRGVNYLPVPTIKPAIIIEFPICLQTTKQWQSAISGNIVVWVDYRNEKDTEKIVGNGDVYGYDLSTNEEFVAAGEPWWEGDTTISGNYIIWMAEPFENPPSIRGYDLKKQKEFLICQSEDCNGWGGQPGISGNNVVFRKGTYGNWYIWNYEITTGISELITRMEIYEFKPPPDHPTIGGNIIAWEDDRLDRQCFDIWGYNISTRTEFPICTDKNPQWEPSVSNEGIVVWEDERNKSMDIYGFDTSTGREFPVCTEQFNQGRPVISGNIIIWQDFRHGNWDIYGFDLSTQTEFPICINPADQKNPAFSGNTVVWEDFRHGNWDIYGATIIN